MTKPVFPSSAPALGPNGAMAHPDAVAHLDVLRQQFYTVGEHAWCFVGNGLSNQTFVRGPEGIIAIDSGECVEEMQAALTQLRTVTDAPVVACIYTHFHYVNGTQAILDKGHLIDIYGHRGIDANRRRFAGDVAPRSNRGLVHQFGTLLPDTGPDALLHCGLGLSYRNPQHAPFSPGYVPATHTIEHAERLTIAGLEVTLTPAPSDATDSITIHFPELALCVNNLIWPALFNIFAIRGEEYRDPRIVLAGIDHIASLAPKALIGTHGPPLTGEGVAGAITDYRDAIQFIWDQTVRLINKGATLADAVNAIRLPPYFQRSYLTRELYGLVEHHVRQIHAGLFGWFDETESRLLTLPTQERHARLIAGFGGRGKVRRACRNALAAEDYPWALELGTWLARSQRAQQQDKNLLASVLRAVAYSSTSANVRNWTLTRALELEGSIDLSRYRVQRFSARQVLRMPQAQSVALLRLMLNPERAATLPPCMIAWHFAGSGSHALHIRHQIAVPMAAGDADIRLVLSYETWAEVVGGKRNFWAAEAAGLISIEGDVALLRAVFGCF